MTELEEAEKAYEEAAKESTAARMALGVAARKAEKAWWVLYSLKWPDAPLYEEER